MGRPSELSRGAIARGGRFVSNPDVPTRHERSAGFIVYHDLQGASPGNRRFLLLNYGRHWDFPKGHLEPGEDEIAAARRELAEETGIEGIRTVEGFARDIEYFFRHPRRGLVRKTVRFFLAASDTAEIRLSHEHCGFVWLPLDEALPRVTFPAARDVLSAAGAFLERGIGSCKAPLD